MKEGTPKANALVVAEFEVSFLDTAMRFDAKIAFVSTKTGQTHAWTQHRSWSKETLQKLQELRDSMETDAAHAYMGDTAVHVASPTATAPRMLGLAELLEAPQVDG